MHTVSRLEVDEHRRAQRRRSEPQRRHARAAGCRPARRRRRRRPGAPATGGMPCVSRVEAGPAGRPAARAASRLRPTSCAAHCATCVENRGAAFGRLPPRSARSSCSWPPRASASASLASLGRPPLGRAAPAIQALLSRQIARLVVVGARPAPWPSHSRSVVRLRGFKRPRPQGGYAPPATGSVSLSAKEACLGESGAESVGLRLRVRLRVRAGRFGLKSGFRVGDLGWGRERALQRGDSLSVCHEPPPAAECRCGRALTFARAEQRRDRHVAAGGAWPPRPHVLEQPGRCSICMPSTRTPRRPPRSCAPASTARWASASAGACCHLVAEAAGTPPEPGCCSRCRRDGGTVNWTGRGVSGGRASKAASDRHEGWLGTRLWRCCRRRSNLCSQPCTMAAARITGTAEASAADQTRIVDRCCG